MGFNNSFDKKYTLVKLEYKKTIILEQLIRYTNCNEDDVIISECFKKDNELFNWKLERVFDDDRNEVNLDEQ